MKVCLVLLLVHWTLADQSYYEYASSVSHLTKEFLHKQQQLNTLRKDDAHFSDVFDKLSPLNLLKGAADSGLYLPNPSLDISDECRKDIQRFNEEVVSLQIGWSHQMKDSWGKSADGVIWGNAKILGFIEECLGINQEKYEIDFKGQYCSIAFPNLYPYPQNIEQKRILDTVRRESVIRNIPVPPLYAIPNNTLQIYYGTCMPSSCTQDELEISVNTVLEDVGAEIQFIHCQTDDSFEIDGSEIFGIVMFSVIGFILLIATVADLVTRNTSYQPIRKGPLKFLIAFSVWLNFPKIFRMTEKSPPNVITCVHGIRALSLFWVIWGHQLAFSLQYVVNLLSVTELTDPLIAQTIVNADKSVDSFFMLGGIFVTLGVLNQLEKSGGRFNIIMYYVHRLIRLWPALAVTVLWVATISTMQAGGPLGFSYVQSMEMGCRKLWYYDLTFVSNYLAEPSMFNQFDEGEIVGSSCIGQSWYISCDMQIYIFLPVVILPLYFFPMIGKILMAFWTLASLAVPGIIVGVYDFRGANTLGPTKNPEGAARMTYTTPWFRVQAVLVGVWAGYVLFKYKKPKLNWIQVSIIWFIALNCIVWVLYGIYPYDQASPDTEMMPLVDSIIFNMMQRATWSLGLAMVVLACHWGYGGFINTTLSHPCWQPLSRLSYTMFLAALPLQFIIITSKDRIGYLNHFSMFQSAIASVIVTLFIATAISLIAEGPFLNLEKILFHKGSSKPEIKEKTPVDFGKTNENFEMGEKNEEIKANPDINEENGENTVKL